MDGLLQGHELTTKKLPQKSINKRYKRARLGENILSNAIVHIGCRFSQTL